ncbi:MAG TPA: DUF1127 domain-containing protein [Stellaceae bacterium]|jgi:uncharacterized protein YjiS (DUF1127 family)|nr:DUF1127 domain-containing protein [Stellaceae bacterium]
MFIINLFANAQHKLSAWRRRHQAYTELMGLDDRSLADIGIHRSEIPGLVYGPPDVTLSRTVEPLTGIFAAHQARLAGGHGALPPL